MKKISLILVIMVVLSSFVFSVNASDDNVYDIPKAVKAPTIDGVMGENEWKNALRYSMSPDERLYRTGPFTHIPESGTFTEAAFYYMWDEKCFYYIAVIDDPTSTDVVPEYGDFQSYYTTDGVHFQFYAADNDTAGNAFKLPHSVWVGAVPRTSENKASTYFEWGISAEATDITDAQWGATVAAKMTGDSAYVIEGAIPWKIFEKSTENGWTGDINGKAGQSMKMETMIWEVDGSSAEKRYTSTLWRAPSQCDIFVLSGDKKAGGSDAPADTTAAVTTAATPTDTTAAVTTAATPTNTTVADATTPAPDTNNAPTDVPATPTGDMNVMFTLIVVAVLLTSAICVIKQTKKGNGR